MALREWVPSVINNLDPFVSSKDIYAGTRWQAELAAQMESTNFGVVCVTQENQLSPWLNFEAGALAKAVDSSRVVPLAIDLKPSDVQQPLGQFQAQPATETGVGEVLSSMNAACDSPLPGTRLERATAKWWPDLRAELERIEGAAQAATPEESGRTDRELLEELLNTVRGLARPPVPAVYTRNRVSNVPVPASHPLREEIAALAQDLDEGVRVPGAG